MATPTPMDGVEPVLKPMPTVVVVEDVEAIPEEIAKKFGELDIKVETTRFVKVEVRNFSLIKDTLGRIELADFPMLGMQWRFLCFPRGNNNDHNVSVYLDYRGPMREPWWGIPVQFVLTAHSEDEEQTLTTAKEAKHRFTATESDWGFTQFVRKASFYTDEIGKRFLVDDVVTLSVAVHIMHDPYGTLWNNFANYDSKKMTGYTGLKNQGATCYMNSILQSLFFTNVFRKAVYQISLEEDKTKNVAYALQKVFYNLQNSAEPVGTTELTKSFGWDLVDSFMQHDVQEFNRVLCDKLETKMKGTSVEGTVQKLLEGQYKMYIKCINVEYESSRVETFYDIQLNVKGLKNLEESFKNYIEIEVMDGDNKYMAAGHGLQDAKKGVIFEKFPPLLHLQLKRFEYDMMRDANVKINDRHEFPLTIDLRPYMSDPDSKPPQVYHLHGVLVHSGDSHGGHYCAFLRPKPDGDWFKFDDDRVTKCSQKEAMDDNFGADLPSEMPSDPPRDLRTMRAQRKFTNAYMLVYIRETELNEILCDVTDECVPELVRERIEKDREEMLRLRLERDQEIHYMDVSVITDETIRQNTNQSELFVRRPELVGYSVGHPMYQQQQQQLLQTQTPGTPKVYHVKKSTTIKEFKELLCRDLRVPNVKLVRMWNIIQRQNATIRPDTCVSTDPVSEQMTLEQVKADLKTKIPLKFYVQVPPGNEDLSEIDPEKFFPPIDRDSKLIFFKSYDPASEKFVYVGPQIVRANERLLDWVETLNKIAGYPPKTALKLYEEIRPDMSEECKLKYTFTKAELGSGDIIIFQKELSPDQAKQYRYPTAKSYLEYLVHRISVRLKPRESPKDVGVSLVLHQKMTYDEVAKAVGEYLKIDPFKLRFTSHRTLPEGPYTEIKRMPELSLEQMLNPYTYGSPTDILYYEKLEVSIIELESKLAKSVVWLNCYQREDGTHQLLMQKTDTVAALLETLKPKVVLKGEQHKKVKPVVPSDIADMTSATSSPMPGAVQSPPNGDECAEQPEPHKKIKAESMAPSEGSSPTLGAALSPPPMDNNGAMDTSPAIQSSDNAAPENTAPENAAPENAAPENAAPENDQGPTPMSGVVTVGQPTLEEKGSGILRAYEMRDNKIFALLDGKTLLRDVHHQIVAEEVPLDHINMDPKDKLIQVAHFHHNTYNFHSHPFLFRITPDEPFSDSKARLRKLLNVSEKEFSKYKFAFVPRGFEKPDYIETDTDVLYSKPWTDRDVLGLDHVDRTSKQGRYGMVEKALVIRN